MHGVVMKIAENQIVVLCDDGKFRNMPRQSSVPALGDRIVIEETASVKRTTGRAAFYRSKGWVAAVFFGLLVLASTFFFEIGLFARPVALVAIDINPSVELMIDHNGIVEQVVLKNAEAELIVDVQTFKQMDFYDAMTLMLSNAQTQGYLNSDSQAAVVMMSVVNLGKDALQVDLNKLPAASQYTVELYYSTREEKKQADDLGLTLNKYHVYKLALEMGIELSIDELRNKSVTDLLVESGLEPRSFFEKKPLQITQDDRPDQENDTEMTNDNTNQSSKQMTEQMINENTNENTRQNSTESVLSRTVQPAESQTGKTSQGSDGQGTASPLDQRTGQVTARKERDRLSAQYEDDDADDNDDEDDEDEDEDDDDEDEDEEDADDEDADDDDDEANDEDDDNQDNDNEVNPAEKKQDGNDDREEKTQKQLRYNPQPNQVNEDMKQDKHDEDDEDDEDDDDDDEDDEDDDDENDVNDQNR